MDGFHTGRAGPRRAGNVGAEPQTTVAFPVRAALERDQTGGSEPVAAARRIPLTHHRTVACDIAHFARQMPLFPVERTFDLAELAAQRDAANPRIAWSVLFLKAYALVAARHPVLRRAYVGWPWPHFIEWPASIGMVAMNRQTSGDDRICCARFRSPETRTLTELNGHLRWYQTRPIEEAFAKQVRFSRLPTALRRLVWWWNLNVVGPKRASRLGTFSISSLAGQHSLNRGHPTVVTSSLTYGPLDEHRRSVVTLLCDHRVLDGVPAAAALADLEGVLQGEICHELAMLALSRAA
jgi:hypothetical protein